MNEKVSMVLDSREHKLQQLLPDVDVETLDVGDIAFRRGAEIVLIIERKTISDLSSSICDGRSREQKARLLNTGVSRERIMFLIEGDCDKNSNTKIGSLPMSTLLGSIINTQFRDGVRVYKTASINETVEFIKKLVSKLNSDINDFWKYYNEDGMTPASYTATLKTNKKANLTPDVWFIQQISSIPQVSNAMASRICNEYGSFINMFRVYESTPDHLRSKMLCDLVYELNNGKNRKIGPKLSEKVYFYFYGLSDC